MAQTSIAFQIDELERGFREIRRELDEIKKLIGIRRREKTYREIKYELAAARFETSLIRYVAACRKAGFNPGQPRVPAGSREGGRWTSDGDGSFADAGDAQGSPVMSDTNPDSVIPGARYAQTLINIDTSALTGISTIDDTTKRLVNTLAQIKDTIGYASGFSPQRYGVAVHTAFAAAVKAQKLPGIAPSDVETTFGGDYYGAKQSVRTDVVLRNDAGDVIAIYDVKTGEKGIEPMRAATLRSKIGVGNEVPIIQMSFTDGVTRKYRSCSEALLAQVL